MKARIEVADVSGAHFHHMSRTMDHQTEPGEKLAASPERIWLAPACNVDERSWCEDDIGCCDECGEPTIEYRRADLIEAELARLRAEIERLRAHLDGANQLDVARIQEIKRQREALEQIKELETLEDGKLSTSSEIADRALCLFAAVSPR